jgi:hypothetical protein
MRDEFEQARALFDEALRRYETAKADLEAIQRILDERAMTGKVVTVSDLDAEELARIDFLYAREWLSRHKPALRGPASTDGDPPEIPPDYTRVCPRCGKPDYVVTDNEATFADARLVIHTLRCGGCGYLETHTVRRDENDRTHHAQLSAGDGMSKHG